MTRYITSSPFLPLPLVFLYDTGELSRLCVRGIKLCDVKGCLSRNFKSNSPEVFPPLEVYDVETSVVDDGLRNSLGKHENMLIRGEPFRWLPFVPYDS